MPVQTHVNSYRLRIYDVQRPTQTNNLPVNITSNYPRSFVIVANQFVTTTCCINNASVAFVKKIYFFEQVSIYSNVIALVGVNYKLRKIYSTKASLLSPIYNIFV